MEVNALHNVQAPRIYHSDSELKCLMHVSVSECAIYIWWKVLLAGEMLGHIDYRSVPDAVKAHLALQTF